MSRRCLPGYLSVLNSSRFSVTCDHQELRPIRLDVASESNTNARFPTLVFLFAKFMIFWMLDFISDSEASD